MATPISHSVPVTSSFTHYLLKGTITATSFSRQVWVLIRRRRKLESVDTILGEGIGCAIKLFFDGDSKVDKAVQEAIKLLKLVYHVFEAVDQQVLINKKWDEFKDSVNTPYHGIAKIKLPKTAIPYLSTYSLELFIKTTWMKVALVARCLFNVVKHVYYLAMICCDIVDTLLWDDEVKKAALQDSVNIGSDVLKRWSQKEQELEKLRECSLVFTLFGNTEKQEKVAKQMVTALDTLIAPATWYRNFINWTDRLRFGKSE